MEIIYDVNSDYWRSIYRKLFEAHNVTQLSTRLELEHSIRRESIDIVKDIDGRWLAVKIPSQEDAIRLSLMYGE
jgi:hypothetical protein